LTYRSGVLLTSSPHCRSGYFFCHETKEAKIQVILLGFFPRGAIALQKREHHRLLIFCPLPALAFASAKSKMPLPPHGPACAARLSAEAEEDDEPPSPLKGELLNCKEITNSVNSKI